MRRASLPTLALTVAVLASCGGAARKQEKADFAALVTQVGPGIDALRLFDKTLRPPSTELEGSLGGGERARIDRLSSLTHTCIAARGAVARLDTGGARYTTALANGIARDLAERAAAFDEAAKKCESATLYVGASCAADCIARWNVLATSINTLAAEAKKRKVAMEPFGASTF